MKTGPQYKIARRLGARIFPKTQTAKFTISGTERKKPAGKGKRSGGTDFGIQLIEKQKARFTYGVMEKQFSNYVKKVRTMKGIPAANLHRLLELRLDNVVFRLGLVGSRRFARQAVSHGHIMVNGRKVTIPSYQVKVGDVITVRTQSKDNGIFREIAARLKDYTVPEWLDLDSGKLTASIKHEPKTDAAAEGLNFGTILEFYSRV
jgi:small subunit ribosomal protein S4